ncbi:MAG: hypothetical protein GF308_05780 [Candidatus Heimdallarchaeota archaeon]|nr:hypothetical protein [Candidatus Heimdallarchaeota archaeon]
MKSCRGPKLIFIFSLFTFLLAFSTVIFVVGENYTLVKDDFLMDPSQPPIISEASFSLNEDNEYVYGIPQSNSVGGLSEAENGAHYFEMWSSGRVEVYFLDSLEYLAYSQPWPGTPPEEYSFQAVCNGYLKFEFNAGNMIPKLVLLSDDEEVTGRYFWSEGLTAKQYSPYYLEVRGSDRTTQDTLRIFNVNASITAYVLTQDQYESYQTDPHEEPQTFNSYAYESGTNITLQFDGIGEESLHLLLWHEELHGRVSGSMLWEYSYQRTFLENYWSLFLVIFLIILVVVFAIFQKVLVPPVVKGLSLVKCYVITIPWISIKQGFSWLWTQVVILWARLRGEEDEGEEESILPED